MAQNRTNTSNAKRETTPPKLFAYHVAERGEKSYWTRIGAAWEHKDGGFTVLLDLVPADGGRIVLRPSRDEAENGNDGAEA